MYFKMDKDLQKDGKMTETVSSSQQVLVQVAKEPISTKGPRLSAEVTLAGRYLVLVPFSEKFLSVKKSRITLKERALKN